MKKFNLNDFTKGWIVGQFRPTIIDTGNCELAIKKYKAGDYEEAHHHKLAGEITVIVSGEVEMDGVKYSQDDIILIEKNENTDFKCLTDVITVVYKTGSYKGDKYKAQ